MSYYVDSDSHRADIPNFCGECGLQYGGLCYVQPPEIDGEVPYEGKPVWCPLKEGIPLEPLCKWLAHYCAAPVPTGQEPLKGIALNKIGWESWFRGGFQEWLRMEKE